MAHKPKQSQEKTGGDSKKIHRCQIMRPVIYLQPKFNNRQ